MDVNTHKITPTAPTVGVAPTAPTTLTALTVGATTPTVSRSSFESKYIDMFNK